MTKGFIIARALAVLTLGGAFTYTAVIASMPRSPLNVATRYATPTAADVTNTLHRLGLSPQHLTAAGVTAQQTTTLVSAMESTLNGEPGLIRSLEDDLGEAQRRCDTLTRLVRSGEATEQQRTDCAAAQAALVTARAALNEALDDLFADLTGGLDEAVCHRLTMLRANAATWDMPTEFLVVTRTDAQWLELRAALANERIAANMGEETGQGAQTILQNARSDASVALARTNLDNNLAAIQNAWNEALNP